MKEGSDALLRTARAKLESRRLDSAESLKNAVLAAGEEHGLKLGKAQAPVRVAVTGRTVGLPLFESLRDPGPREDAGPDRRGTGEAGRVGAPADRAAPSRRQPPAGAAGVRYRRLMADPRGALGRRRHDLRLRGRRPCGMRQHLAAEGLLDG